MKNQVQLITYPDSLGGSLSALSRILAKYLPRSFGGIHILPPFPSTGDRGFAPVSYREIDPSFGSWDDVHQLGAVYDVMLDFMVNHISRHSSYFQDFVRMGRTSAYADLFISLDKIWPGGVPLEADVKKIFLRRPHNPFLDVRIEKDGSTERIWATFGKEDWSEQIDIDVNSEVGWNFIRDNLNFFASQGVSTLRLDAVAFVIKKAGTSCFLVEPQIGEFLSRIHEQARLANIELLLEVHTHPAIQSELARRGYWVYNFVLPLLTLHTILNCSSAALKNHLGTAPRQQITMLDCHDGIPVQPDIEGLLDTVSMKRIVDHYKELGVNVSRIYSREHQGKDGFDTHQINCTYYSALGSDADAYTMARAIQFFSPGIPQIYYVGLLAGENMPLEVDLQEDQRAINRYNYSEDEVTAALQKPVVQRLLKLIQFRNQCAAFQGDFMIEQSDDQSLSLNWDAGHEKATLSANLLTRKCVITWHHQGKVTEYVP